MSPLRLNGSTSGYSEVSAPAIAANQVFTLPATGGNIITDVSDLTTQVKTATNATGSAPIYSCRAWVNFNGTGTVAIRSSGNVSSITDNGTGDYTVNFTTALVDANYTAITGVGVLNSTSEFQSQCNVNGTYLTTSIRLATGYIASTSEALQDKSVIQIAIFR